MTQENAEILLCNLPEEDVERLRKEVKELIDRDYTCLLLLNIFNDVDFYNSKNYE